MKKRQTAPFGSWSSPLTSDLIASKTIKLGQIQVDDLDIYWVESRPSEGGRNVVVRKTPDNLRTDLTPLSYNVRTRVHEYGGGAYLVSRGIIYFSNDSDQRVYKQTQHDFDPKPITAEGPFRYADYLADPSRNRLICIREDHSATNREPANTVVSISNDADSLNPHGHILVAGHDFYASPRISPDGQQLAWLAWNHPNMPWDGTELWVAAIQPDGSLTHASCVAGGSKESIFQPEWSPTGVLHFVSDRTGWWNLYHIDKVDTQALYTMEAEFGLPQWMFGLSTYAFESPNQIICSYTQRGRWHLGRLDTISKTLTAIDSAYTHIQGVQIGRNHLFFTGSSPTESDSIVQLDLTAHCITILHRSLNCPVTQEYFSLAEELEYATESSQQAYAFFYPPHNHNFHPPPDERPPLIVKSHGGPTGTCEQSLDLKIQYWTSRGFAVLDVNYGGSTGYGRHYRNRLNGQWGIVDVTDCINGAQYLIQQGRVDPKRIVISGSSAGGFTTLCALTFHNTFAAGSSYYGISDLEGLVQDTHKFEARYLDRLVGPYPEKLETYHQRSPIHFADQLSCPIIVFQGQEDKVVPPDQAEKMVAAVKEKGIPVAYLTFDREQHGFRKASTIKCVLDAELYFYSRIFSFTPAAPTRPIQIFNLPSK